MVSRPNFNLAVKALIKDVAATMEEFRHIRPSRILVVAGEARRASRGTVKPLTFEGAKTRDRSGRKKPMVKVRGRRMLYCITLRPLFFRTGTARARITTLLHELFHISSSFDGTLALSRRHAELGKDFAKRLRPLVRRYLKRCPPELLKAFGHDGEVRVQQWLERPGPGFFVEPASSRKVYTEDHLFCGVVEMVTGRKRASGQRKPKLH